MTRGDQRPKTKVRELCLIWCTRRLGVVILPVVPGASTVQAFDCVDVWCLMCFDWMMRRCFRICFLFYGLNFISWSAWINFIDTSSYDIARTSRALWFYILRFTLYTDTSGIWRGLPITLQLHTIHTTPRPLSQSSGSTLLIPMELTGLHRRIPGGRECWTLQYSSRDGCESPKKWIQLTYPVPSSVQSENYPCHSTLY